MAIGKFTLKNGDYFYFVFRVLVGLLFLSHGAQKLFGAFGGAGPDGGAVQLFSLFGLAGIIEFFGGIFIVVGFLTRWTALVSAVEMIVAYFMVHSPGGFFPILNGGELVVLYFASFLVILVYGARKWGLDNVLFRSHNQSMRDLK
jgi:putative oxidoreductase